MSLPRGDNLTFFLTIFSKSVRISPNFTCIVLGSSNNGISFIVELTRENLIFVTFKHLENRSSFNIPYFGSLIKTSWKDFCTLRIEQSLWNLGFMTLQNFQALECCHIIDSACCVDRSCYQLGSNCIKIEIQNLIIMAFKNSHAFTCTNIPKSAGFIDGGSSTNVTSKLKLGSWDLSSMSRENSNCFSNSCVPNNGSSIEWTSKYFISICIETQRNNFAFVALESRVKLPRFQIPQFGSLIHGTSG